MEIDSAKIKKFTINLLRGKNTYSILFYIIVIYLASVYVALPAVYAFTPVSYISSVLSGSMSHSAPTIQLTYYDWLTQHGFNNSQTSTWPYQRGIDIGSLLIAYKVSPEQIKVGDVIIFDAFYNGVYEDIVHRVINITVINGTYYYTTKGDANPSSLPIEVDIPYSHVVGKVGDVIPYLGYPRYLLYLLGNLL